MMFYGVHCRKLLLLHFLLIGLLSSKIAAVLCKGQQTRSGGTVFIMNKIEIVLIENKMKIVLIENDIEIF